MTTDDRRLIEDYLPVSWLSAEASGEPRTKGHISTLHLVAGETPPRRLPRSRLFRSGSRARLRR